MLLRMALFFLNYPVRISQKSCRATETLRADEYCIAVKDGTHDTPKPVDFGYKLVTGKHVKNGQIDSSSAYYISEEDYNAINKRSMVERWDVIMSMIGTVGEAAVVKNDPDYAIKNVALFKCGGSEVRGKWLCYYLNSPEGKGKMLGEMKGSSQQFLSLKQLRELPIMFSEEKVPRIVEIISNYDDLIENNQKQIKLLEEAAQRLYKEWFVDLRFPGHENTKIVDGVPERWSRGLLKELISVNYGKDHKKAPDDGNIPVYGSGGLMRKCNKSLFSGEAVLIPRKGSLNNIMYVDETFWTVDTMFYATMKQPHTAVFVYFFVKAFDMYSMNIGAAVPSMTAKILDAMDVVIPDKETMEKFDKRAKTYFNKIKTLQGQNNRLKIARDLLLPKLMYETQKGDF